MKLIDILRLAMRIFKTNRLRTILTIMGVSIGIGAIFFLVSLGYGIQQLTINRIASSDALLTLDVSTGKSDIIKLDKKATESFKTIAGYSEMSPLLGVAAQAGSGESNLDTFINGILPGYFRLSGMKVKYGKPLDVTDTAMAVITSHMATGLGIASPDQALGKKISLNFIVTEEKEGGDTVEKTIAGDTEFEIKGVIEDSENVQTYIPLSALDKLEIDEYQLVKVKARDRLSINQLRDKIQDKGYVVASVSDTLDQLDKVFKVIQIILGGFGIIALLVASIGMFNTMTIALLERTREIGIMKALGVKNADVWRLFLTESMVIGTGGGMLGILFGWGGGEAVNALLNILAGQLGGERVDIFSSPSWFIILVLGFSTIVGFSTGIYPARRAARINPLVALRYE